MNFSEAKRLGLDRYTNGRACGRGHKDATWIITGHSVECAECREDRMAQARVQNEQQRVERIAAAKAARELAKAEAAQRLAALTIRVARPVTVSRNPGPDWRFGVGVYLLADEDDWIATDPYVVGHLADSVTARGERLAQFRPNSFDRISGNTLHTSGITFVGSIEPVNAPPLFCWPHGQSFPFSDRVIPAPGLQGYTGPLPTGGHAAPCPGTISFMRFPEMPDVGDRFFSPSGKMYESQAVGPITGIWVEVDAAPAVRPPDIPPLDPRFVEMAARQKAAVDSAMRGFQHKYDQSPSIPVRR
jgi:hypothetical protein